MATITGSSTIDWSNISLAQVDFAGDIVRASNRSDELSTEFASLPITFPPFVMITPTLIVADLPSGGKLSIGGVFNSAVPTIRSFNFIDTATGEVLRITGSIDSIGNDTLTSVTIGSTGFLETFTGNITIFPAGNYGGTVTSLVTEIGSARVIFSGNLRVAGDDFAANLTGTVTGISVVSGADTITMTGLSLSIDVVEAALVSGDLATVNDLFSVVGSLMTSNDTITYANNSGVGMTFNGGAGNDTITISGPNVDILIGGIGDDTYILDDAADTIVENLGGGSDTIRTAVSFTLPDAALNIENLTLTGAGNIDGTGNTTGNILTGNSGNNVLSGGAGNDTMRGGLGNDTYSVDSAGDVVTEALNAGIDLVQSSAANFTLGANVENLTLLGGTNINGTGNSLANVLTDNNGVNILAGGAGSDTYIVQNGADSVVESLNAGIDLVQSTAANFTLGANVENLTLLGGTNINGTGNTLANIIVGNSGVNQLTGLAGNDTLDGGADNDTMDGGAGNDIIVIGTAADHGGSEVITGGLGTDVIRFTSTIVDETLVLNATVTGMESVVIGTAAGLTTGTTALNVNAFNVVTGLTLTGNAGDNVLTGTGANDILNGGAGHDTLNGGAGTNALIGGIGNDRYIVDFLTNGVSEGLNAGTDTVSASLNYTLTANVENLELTGSALTGTGNTLANILTGTSGNNTLSGLAGNDTLIGGAGQDTVTGGLGNDRIVMEVTAGSLDVADGGTGTDILALVGTVGGNGVMTVNLAAGSGDQVTLNGGGAEGLLQNNFEGVDASGLGSSVNATGSAGANLLIGSSGADTLTGLAGNDTLDGGADNDTLNAGDGNDVILIGNASDHGLTEVIDGGAGTDVIRFTSTIVDETLVLNATVTGMESVVIGTAAGLTTGTTALNVNAFNVVTGLTLTGNAGDNVLTGTGANDILNGGAGHDTLNGGAGTNALIGGIGNDRYIVNTATNVVSEGLNAGTDTVVASLNNYTLGANLENLELTGSALTGTGNTLANILTGTSGNNTLSGLAGNDTLIGGAGQDTVTGGLGNDRIVMEVTAGSLDVADGGTGTDILALVGTVGGNGVMTVNLAAGSGDQVTLNGGGAEGLLQNNFEGVDASGLGSSVNATGSAAANVMIGSSGADTLTGLAGNDTLDGGAGDDTMDGGAGNDTYMVDSLGDSVTETLAGAAGGTDLVLSAVDNFTLSANVENLTLTGSAHNRGWGNAHNNIITGNSGHNLLSGLDGNDNLNGGDGDDALFGGLGNDILIGGNGADILDGSPGSDNMMGGLGDDFYMVEVASDVVTEALNAGIDTVVASLNYTLGANVENLTLTDGAISGTGNALNNIITGNIGSNLLSGLAGNDTLTGGLGNDTLNGGLGIDAMAGGSGDDLFVLDTAADTALEASGEGSDTVRLAYNVVGPTLIDLNSDYGGNIENVQVTGTGLFNLTGNADANSLIGNGSNNILRGNVGDDTLSGLAGNDSFLFGIGDGQDLVRDNSGSADKVVFDSGINPLDLVISRQANNLWIAIHGSSDQVTVENWYTSAVNRTETIQAGNGELLLSTKVEQLIQAMASFTQQTGLTWDQAIDQQPQDVQAILAANWQ